MSDELVEQTSTDAAASDLTLDDFLGIPDDFVDLVLRPLRGSEDKQAIARFRQIGPDTLRDYKNLLTGNFGRKQPNQKAAFDLITDKCFVEFQHFTITDPELYERFDGNTKAWLKRGKRGQHVQENIVPTYMGMITPTVEEKN